jgi:hypothetical protein
VFRPLPPWFSRPFSILVLVAWALQMAVLLRSLRAEPVNLAGDLARYGTSAVWKGVYSRGEKIGFMVGQTVATDDGYELQEEGQLQMLLLGATASTRLKTTVRVDRAFEMRSFSFSLDPGTGAIQVDGRLEGKTRLHLSVKTPSGTRTEVRDLPETPALSLNLPRRLAAAGLAPGQKIEVPVFDPATMRNASMTVSVLAREVTRAAGRPVPAFKVQTSFSGITSTSWITDTGEVVREESPLGFLVVKETPQRATALAVPGEVQSDLLEAAAVVPNPRRRIDNPEAVDRMVLQLDGLDLTTPDVQGGGQTVTGNRVELRDSAAAPPEPAGDLAPYLRPELFIESDAPEIVAEAKKAAEGLDPGRSLAEKLVRHVNALLEKKPTVSLPSAAEVLRTGVGDCNEHTVLYVAMARALGIPSRIAVGLVYLHGGFYYHAWPEVFVKEGADRGRWIAVDPTLNQFPADVTHVRIARGGLDKQAVILTSIGQARMRIVDLDVRAGFTPVLVGRPTQDLRPPQIDLPRRQTGGGCWSQPAS